ncbi:MAG: glycosyltransferase, partial [Bacteroidaceae bacterium]|nr:glycosyltransferase [Bacteroidaceae bacterium]
GKGYLKCARWLIREISRFSLAFCINSSNKFVLLSQVFIPIAKKYARVTDDSKYVSITNPMTISTPTERVSKEKHIIYVGRIDYYQKHTYRVIDIWRELEEKHPDWKLTIVGDGPNRIDIEARIKEYGLQRVTITGFTPPDEYYQRASILLLTSEYEGFGLVILEAMTHGVVPVVYNSFETASELIKNNENGILVETPYCVTGFTTVLQELMTNEAKLKEIAENAKYVSNRFAIENVANEWYRLMN